MAGLAEQPELTEPHTGSHRLGKTTANIRSQKRIHAHKNLHRLTEPIRASRTLTEAYTCGQTLKEGHRGLIQAHRRTYRLAHSDTGSQTGTEARRSHSFKDAHRGSQAFTEAHRR